MYAYNTVERHKERSVSATESTVVIEDLENSPTQKKRLLSTGEQLYGLEYMHITVIFPRWSNMSLKGECCSVWGM